MLPLCVHVHKKALRSVLRCIILTEATPILTQEGMHMNDYSKITALYSRLSVGDEDRDGGESGRFFDRSAYSRMIEDVENGKIGVCIMKDMTRWGRDITL